MISSFLHATNVDHGDRNDYDDCGDTLASYLQTISAIAPAIEIETASNTIETLYAHFHTTRYTAGFEIVAMHINHAMCMQHRADAH